MPGVGVLQGLSGDRAAPPGIDSHPWIVGRRSHRASEMKLLSLRPASGLASTEGWRLCWQAVAEVLGASSA